MTLLLFPPIFSSSSLLSLAHFYVVNLLQSSHSFEGDSDDDDELLEEEPELATAKFNHIGGVNRIRVRGLLISYQIYIYMPFFSRCSNYPTLMCFLARSMFTGRNIYSQRWTKEIDR